MNRTTRSFLVVGAVLIAGTGFVLAQQVKETGTSFTGTWNCTDRDGGLKTIMAVGAGGVVSRAIPNTSLPMPNVYSSEVWGAWSPNGNSMNVTLLVLLHRVDPKTMTDTYQGEVRWRGTFKLQPDGTLEGSLLPKLSLVGGGGPPGDAPAFGVKCWRLSASGVGA